MIVVLRGVDVEAAARDDTAFVEGVFAGMAQRHELVIAPALGKIEPRRPAHGFERRVARPFQLLGQRGEFGAARDLVEAPDPHIDRVDLAPAQQRHDLIADLLELQAAAHRVAMIAREIDGALIAEEIRRMQHIDVEHVALDPFAAIEQAPQVAQRAVHADAEGVLHGVDRAHLVGDRANAADAGGDVRRLGEGAAAQERLEEARRLEDGELGAAHLAVTHDDLERSFALDAREIIDLDRLNRHGGRLRRGRPARWR